MRQSKSILPVLCAIFMSICFAAVFTGCPGKTKENKQTEAPADPVTQAEEEFNTAMGLIASDSPKEIKEGLKHAQKSLELAPDQPRPTCVMGTAYRKLGDYDKAIEWYNKAVTLDKEYTICYDNLGLAYHAKMMKAKSDKEREDSYAKAEGAFLKAVEIDKTYADAHFNLGELYSWIDDDAARKEAVKEYETFIKMTDKQDMKAAAQKALVKIKKEI